MNISLSEAIAKKKKDKDVYQSLAGHTEDSLLVFKDYLTKNTAVLKRFSDDFSVDYDLLASIIYLSLYLHDIGKLTVEFQKNIKKGMPCGVISHPFFSFPLISTTLPEEMDIIVRLCILSHHSQLYNRIYEDARLKNRVTYFLKLIKEFINNSKITFNKLELSKFFQLQAFPIYKLSDEYKLDSFQLDADIKDELRLIKYIHGNMVRNNEARTKALYSLVLSILKFCDAKASENFEKADLESGKLYQGLFDIDDSINVVYSRDVINTASIKIFKNSPYNYQTEVNRSNGLTFLISAPCGRGKTEAALSKAISIIEKEGKNKLIFALPTQITSNAMYSRLKEIFGAENVGIYHGLSRFVHYVEDNIVTEDDEDVIKDDDISTIVREEKVFLKPLTVTTVDHLVYSLVHGYKQADYALGNILASVVIFDEIHYYEHHTLRYIIEAMEILRKLKVPHIAMSGTLPDCIVKNLGYEYSLIEDREGFEFKPFIIESRTSFMNEAIDEIVELYESGEKQIIILNTIGRAQDIYSQLIEEIGAQDNIILYHSMFTHYDRAYSEESKESTIFSWKNNKNAPERWIIVSTQAIEISVDISCTVMHTEIAPIDAIGQRGGRLNRGAKHHNNTAKMIVYRTENYRPYYFGKDGEVNFVQRTEEIIKDGEITYQTIRDWCSKVYHDVTLNQQNLTRIFNECTLFGYSPREVRYSEDEGNLVKFRETHFIKQDVIPEVYWDSVLRKFPELIMVKIPYWWLKKYPDFFYIEDEKHTICRLPYSADTGFSLEEISSADKSCLIF